jgi:DNA-3-methyladenine glycosylase I
MLIRCAWAGTDPLVVCYHDTEWGVPLHDDRRLFEFLVLESAQAGLSWITILRKRENYRQAFDGFDPQRVAVYDAESGVGRSDIIDNGSLVSYDITHHRQLDLEK